MARIYEIFSEGFLKKFVVIATDLFFLFLLLE